MATTLVQLKMKKTELRNKIDAVLNGKSGNHCVPTISDSDLLNEYRKVAEQVKNAESRLLK